MSVSLNTEQVTWTDQAFLRSGETGLTESIATGGLRESDGSEYKRTPRRRDDRFKTLRRMRGFLVETNGAESKVVFVENGQKIIYFLPTDRLARCGVTVPNQPFQMDEVEFRPGHDAFGKGYIFRAIAEPQDAVKGDVLLDANRKAKLEAILRNAHGA